MTTVKILVLISQKKKKKSHSLETVFFLELPKSIKTTTTNYNLNDLRRVLSRRTRKTEDLHQGIMNFVEMGLPCEHLIKVNIQKRLRK